MKQLIFVLLLLSTCAFGQSICSGSMIVGGCPIGALTATVTFLPSAIVVGQTSQATVFIMAGNVPNLDGTQQCSQSGTWASDTPTVATVSSTGLVTGVAAGTANISCTFISGLAGSAPITIEPTPLITNPNAATCATPCVLPAATNGTAYSFLLAATGGTTPYTWSVSVGSLPTGLTLSATGCPAAQGNCNIQGTPTVNGTSTFTIQVTGGTSTTLQMSITVSAAAACGTPPNYCSRQDTQTSSGASVNGGNPPTNLVGLNCPDAGVCANAFWQDDNNSGPAKAYVWRMTDHTMVGANAGKDWTMTTPSSSTQRNWAANTADPHVVTFSYSKQSAQAFFAISAGTPPTHTAKGNATQDKNGFSIGGTEFSGIIQAPATNLLFYSCGSNPASFPTRNVLAKYVLDETNAAWTASTGLGQNLAAAITATSLLDPITVPGLTSFMTGQTGPHWNRWMAAGCADISADRVDHVAAIDYRYAQDRGSLIVSFDQSTSCARWLDVRTGQVGGSVACGPTGSTTGFGPLPAPAAPALTMATTGGTLDCTHTYKAGLSYTVRGTDGTAGESLLGSTATVGPNGAGATCSISVTPPVANPGGGSGINLSLTATHYNGYVCDQTLGGSGCVPTLQGNTNNSHGTLAQPTILSVTGCTTGTSSNTVTYWLVSSNGSGATINTSIPSASVSQTVTSNVAPGCTITVSSLDPNAAKYWVLRDDPSIQTCSFVPPATSCKDSTQNPFEWGNQTTPIGTSETIASINSTSLTAPTVNQAGPLIHNFRFDPTTGVMVMTTTNGYQNTQGSPANAPFELYWNPTGVNIIAANTQVQTCPPYASYASGHWTHVPYNGNGSAVNWLQGVRDEGIISWPLNASTCAGLNYTFLNQANAGLDTQSGDQHLSGNYPPLVFRDAYSLTNAFVLPSVPYTGEVTAWQLPVTITSVSRAGCPGACVVTVTTSAGHNLQNNVNVYLNGVTDTSFNGAVNGATSGQNLTVTGATTFTFTQATGANGTSSGGYVDRPMIRAYHTWDAAQAWAGTGSNFNSTPRGSISQDGIYFCNVTDAMRNSNGVQGTASASLGSVSGATTCTPGSGGDCRYDPICGQIK